MPRSWPRHGDVATCLAYLAATVVGGLALVVAGHDARPEAGRRHDASSPTLGLALLVAAAGGAGAVLRALLIHHSACAVPTRCPSAPWSSTRRARCSSAC